jgi:undecaprenyl-diphosphatase
MRARLFLLLIAGLCLAPVAAQPEGPSFHAGRPLSKLSPAEAIILGVVEGVTEFLPISSTGHLIIATHFLHLDTEQVLLDRDGEPIWYRKPSAENEGQLLTVKIATEAYIVVIQIGAILAIIPICWSQLVMMVNGVLGRDPAGRRLLRNLAIAFVPSAVLGLLLHDWVDDNLYSIGAVIFALGAGACLMFVADRWPKWMAENHSYRNELTPWGAALIGFLQCVAMWPGTSRPMMTMVGGYFAGLRPGPAAGFSFLLGFVTLSVATLYKGYRSGDLILQVFGWQNVLLGILVAGVTASVSARFFLRLLLEKGLAPFAWYRLALAAALLLAF